MRCGIFELFHLSWLCHFFGGRFTWYRVVIYCNGKEEKKKKKKNAFFKSLIIHPLQRWKSSNLFLIIVYSSLLNCGNLPSVQATALHYLYGHAYVLNLQIGNDLILLGTRQKNKKDCQIIVDLNVKNLASVRRNGSSCES